MIMMVSRIKGFFNEVWYSMLLQKTVPEEEESELDRTLTQFNVFIIVVGVLSFSFYQEMPVAINNFGYMIFFPLFLAGIMSFITSMCYAELISMNATSGGCYRYVYSTLGEFFAFLVGWSVICICTIRIVYCLEYMIRVIDISFLNGTLSGYKHEVPSGGFENYFIRIYPKVHFETIITTLIVTAICAIHLKYCKLIVGVAAIANMMILFVCLTIFWFCMDLSKFNIVSETNDFTFFTRGALLGNFFYMEFGVALYFGREAINPNRSVPKGLVEGCKWGFLLYIASTILYSMRPGEGDIDMFNPMQAALRDLGIQPFHVLPTIGIIVSYFMNSVSRTFIFSRTIYTMAQDGMLFSFLGFTEKRTKNPMAAVLLCGGICGIVAMFVGPSGNSRSATLTMSNVVRIFMLVCHLVTRYRWEPVTGKAIVFYEQRPRWLLINYPSPVLIPNETTQAVSFKLIFLSVTSAGFSLFVVLNFIIRAGHPSALLKMIFLFTMFISLVAIYLLSLQPQNERKKLSYMVRGVPFTPILAICWDFIMLILMPHSAWVKVACWWLIGTVLYFSCFCMRTNEYRSTRGEERSEATEITPEPSSSDHFNLRGKFKNWEHFFKAKTGEDDNKRGSADVKI